MATWSSRICWCRFIDFSAGKLAPSVKKELGARMAFDASNGKGPLKRRAQQIIDNVQN